MKTFLLLAVSALSSGALAIDFTLKSEVSGADFDWTLGSNYVGEPANGPQNGDKIIVPEGVTAQLPQEATNKNGLFANLDFEVQSGGTLVVYCPDSERHYSYVRTITGEGTVASTQADAKDFYVMQSCRFDGIFSGKINIDVNSRQRLELTRADHACTGAPILKDFAVYTVNRFFPATGSGSTPGKSSFNFSDENTIEYIGVKDVSETINPALWATRKIYINASGEGSLYFKADYGKQDGWQRYTVLTGDNTVGNLRFSAQPRTSTGVVAISKEGRSTWTLVAANSDATAASGVISIRDGTLKYADLIQPTGTRCALGLSTMLYRPAFLSSLKSTDQIPYAILFDGSAETVGYLEATYQGNSIVTNYDRKIGIDSIGGFRSAAGRLHMNDISAASAGEKTLVLDGDEDHNDTISTVTNGVGVISVEKRGSGVWTLQPPFDISGKIEVKEGELDILNGGDRWNWFKLRLKENRFTNPSTAEEAAALYEAETKSVPTDGVKKYMQLSRARFLDAEGKVINAFEATSEGSKLSVQPTNAYSVCCRPMEMAIPEGRSLFWLEDTRPLSSLFTTVNNWLTQAAPAVPDVNDESTWMDLICRLNTDVAEIKYCDFLSSLGEKHSYGGRVPTAIRIDASCDGITWETIFDRNDLTPPAAAGAWYSGRTTGGPSTLDFGTQEKNPDGSLKFFKIDKTKPTALPAIDLEAVVSVAAGATLRCRGAVNISKLAIEGDAMGAILGGANLAASGELTVDPLPVGMGAKTYATSLKTVAGASNLKNWTVNGGAYRLEYDEATGNITVSRQPTLLLFK